MTDLDPKRLHKIYGLRRQRLAYRRDDFLDYVLMIAACEAILCLSFGATHVVALFGAVLCVFEIIAFARRHGVRLRVPLLLRRPQDVFYMVLYRLQNLTVWYFLAIGLLLLENYLITLTPALPHQSEWMRIAALGLFYLSFGAIFIYRTRILLSHLKRRAMVKEFLLQTTWKAALTRQPNISFEIAHAYATGLLAHLLLVTPWYLVITHANFSLVFLPVTMAHHLLSHNDTDEMNGGRRTALENTLPGAMLPISRYVPPSAGPHTAPPPSGAATTQPRRRPGNSTLLNVPTWSTRPSSSSDCRAASGRLA